MAKWPFHNNAHSHTHKIRAKHNKKTKERKKTLNPISFLRAIFAHFWSGRNYWSEYEMVWVLHLDDTLLHKNHWLPLVIGIEIMLFRPIWSWNGFFLPARTYLFLCGMRQNYYRLSDDFFWARFLICELNRFLMIWTGRKYFCYASTADNLRFLAH